MTRCFAGSMLVLGLVLSIQPTTFHVEFPSDPDNSAIVMLIECDRPAYSAYQETPILEDGQTSIDIPRHSLPRGSYHITAMLMRWQDGMEIAVDSSDTQILVN